MSTRKVRYCSQLTVVEYLRHVLIEPLDFITGGESEVLRLLFTELCDLFSFDAEPLRRTHRHLALHTNCCHCCVCGGSTRPL